MKKDSTKRNLQIGFIALALSIILMVLAGTKAGFGEWYATHAYPFLVSTVGRLFGILPFSASEIILYILVALLIGSAVYTALRVRRSERNSGLLLNWSSKVFLTVSILALLYVTNCGINYHRIPFSKISGITADDYSVNDLKHVCAWLTREVNEAGSKVSRDPDGQMRLSADMARRPQDAMTNLGTQYPSLSGFYPQPKRILVSEILSWQQLSGIYSPFTIEANYNGDMPDFNIPFTASHELSHLRGFMQEEEANFIAFLACMYSPEPDFQYSGYLSAWIYCTNTLFSSDSQAYAEFYQQLSDDVKIDLQSNRIFWRKYKGRIADISNRINDTYLRANGQEDGVKSYHRMVDLLVTFSKKHLHI